MSTFPLGKQSVVRVHRLSGPKIDEKTDFTTVRRPVVVFRRSTYSQSKVLDRLNTILGRQGVAGYAELPKFPFLAVLGQWQLDRL